MSGLPDNLRPWVDTERPGGRPDPILAAIERHTLALAAFDAAIAGRQPGDDRLCLMDAEGRALWRLVEVRPITARGLWALCDHLAEYAAHQERAFDRRDYDQKRNSSFLPQLLENMRDALDAIKRGDA
jgi:hypothetical protein